MWYDILDKSSIKYSALNLKGKFWQKMHQVHFSNNINRFLNLPFKSIWTSHLSLKESELNQNGENYIIFQTSIKFPPNYIAYLKQEYKCKIILYMPDTIENMGIAKTKQQFRNYINMFHIDECYSFEYSDCMKYDISFFDLYSKINNENSFESKVNLYYIGNCRSTARLNALHSIYNLVKDKVVTKFVFNNVPKGRIMEGTKIIYNQACFYDEVVKSVKESTCILELLNKNQNGNTLRFKEAICYNKKLITNNSEVLKSKYYNEDCIQYFEKIEDINIEWISNNVEVNYNYGGEFSPRKFLLEITK